MNRARGEPFGGIRGVTPALLIALVVLAGCGGAASSLQRHGPAADRIAALWWVMLGIATAVYLAVSVVALWALWPRRRDPWRFGTLEPRVGIVAGGIVLPGMVVSVLGVMSVRTQGALLTSEPPAVVVEVIARQWWWELRYIGPPGAGPMITANELHVPVGRRVELRLFAADVIHSLWVPSLQGKLDLIPGKTNVTWLQADRPGTYRGLCAEYCGLQHARMALLVVAWPPAQFEEWLEAQRRPAGAGTGGRGAALFLTHCAPCHAVRGTAAFFGRLGPDLTHVAGRRTLAAGALPNARAHLAEWIADPQTVKPGNRMPRVDLPADDLRDLVEYVATLR